MRKRIMNLRLFDGGDGDGAAGAGTGNGSQKPSAGYTFEQAEEIANSRAEKASRAALANFYRQQGLSEEEITSAINEFKAKQKANQPNVSALEKERDDARAELQQLKNSSLLRDKGVKAEDIDYVMFKVEKMVDEKTDFAKAADRFLKENPRFTGTGSYRVSASTSSDQNDSGRNLNRTINDSIRSAIKR